MKYCDMHCDTLTHGVDAGKDFIRSDMQISLEKLEQGGCLLQCFAIFLNQKKGDLLQRALGYVEKFEALPVHRVTKCKEIDSSQINALLTIEEGGIFEGKLENVELLYKKGVRMATITWNYENELGFPNLNYRLQGRDLLTTPNTKDGLTALGKEAVAYMGELGMIVDVSHLSDKGFYDVADVLKGPFVASHSNSRAVQNVVRNLTDDQIRVLADHGGVMGLNFCADFVSWNRGDQLEDLLEHAKHIVNTGGVDCLAIGSDFDGIRAPEGLSDCSKMPLLERTLAKAFSPREIEKIFQTNFLRVFSAVCG